MVASLVPHLAGNVIAFCLGDLEQSAFNRRPVVHILEVSLRARAGRDDVDQLGGMNLSQKLQPAR
ncbi:MAG TPA: hypothetical protein VG055_34480 [Planctomycetaceae bacterium]|jgi:hypothetical protein|nr:hypothetical protein [Planctomycetaceae bacterium]